MNVVGPAAQKSEPNEVFVPGLIGGTSVGTAFPGLCFRRTEHAELGGGKGNRRSAQKAAEVAGLDLRRTTPPVTDIIGYITRTYPSQRVLLTTQVYEKLNPTSLRDVQTLLDWSELRVYDLNDAGKNHGILLGTSGWKP